MSETKKPTHRAFVVKPFTGDYVWPAEPLQDTFRPLRSRRTDFLDAA